MNKQHIVGRNPIRVSLNDLDALPTPYAMSFGFELNSLCESIRTIGLVNPPCIGKDEKGRVELVTGYRRVTALKELGWSEVVCEDLSSTLPSQREKMLFALHENLTTRVFNPVENAMVLCRLEPFFPGEEILEKFMPLLSLPSHESTRRFYVELAGMSEEFLRAVAGGGLSLNAAKSLIGLQQKSAESALHCILKLRLNVNQQLQFIELMTDISEAEEKGFHRILAEEPMQAVLKNNHLNRPQKAKNLLEELRARRYPRWKAAEKRFQEQVGRLSLPEGVRIDHPPYFEASGYRLEVRFQNSDDLINKVKLLSQLTDLKEFRDPLRDDD
ncbi:MAG: ParB N-terminal domain-containing protein [Desulfatiglandales bacterium]